MSSRGHRSAAVGDGFLLGFRGRLHSTTMTDDEQPTIPTAPGDGDPHVFEPVPTAAPPMAPPPLLVPEAAWQPSEDGIPPAPLPAGPAGPDTADPKRPGSAHAHRFRIWIWSVVGVLLLGLLVASRINLDYYAIQPGSATSVQQFITVPPAKAHRVAHPLLLTDVREARVTALSYLFFKMQSDTVLYPVHAVTGGTATSELDDQGALQMSQAETAAKTAALRHLGYPVPGTPVGAVISGTFVGTPAYGVLNVGDVVTALDGVATLTARSLTEALAPHHTGQTVTFSVRKKGTGPAGPVALTLKRTKVDVGGQSVYLTVGIEPEDQVDYVYPFPVSIDVKDIGGPSAGLAMTLGLIDTLTSGSLTGGHTVAATGTMDASGAVGDVGGVAQKTVAVEKSGASVFLVPPQEYKAAMSKDRPGLKVYAVSTLDQALRVLGAAGGHVPTTTLAAASSASAG